MNLERMRKKCPNEYAFYPRTWIVPTEMKELKAYYKRTLDSDEEGGGIRTFIVKPESLC